MSIKMPYPAKIDSEEVLQAALVLLEAQGREALSMRTLAAKLTVVPNALYRYYPDKAALEAALGLLGAEQLHLALAATVKGKSAERAIMAVSRAYLEFGLSRPKLYDLTMQNHPSLSGHPEHYAALWGFVVELVSRFSGKPNDAAMAVAFWSFLHGFVGLERADLLGQHKPRGGFEVGLKVFLASRGRE